MAEHKIELRFEFDYKGKKFTGVITNTDEKLDLHRLFDEKDEEIFGGKIFKEFKKTSLGDWYEESEGEEIDTDNLR